MPTTANLNPKLVLLTQKLVKEELATPMAVGEINNPNPQLIGCIMPINDSEALIVINNGNISAVEPALNSPGSKERFEQWFANVNKEAIVFENIEKAEQVLFFGLGADINVNLRNDRALDAEKLHYLISMAAQKAHDNNQFREKVKDEAINFLLQKFNMNDDSQHYVLPQTFAPKAQIANENDNWVEDLDDDNIKISDLAKRSNNLISEGNSNLSQKPADLLPPIN